MQTYLFQSSSRSFLTFPESSTFLIFFFSILFTAGRPLKTVILLMRSILSMFFLFLIARSFFSFSLFLECLFVFPILFYFTFSRSKHSIVCNSHKIASFNQVIEFLLKIFYVLDRVAVYNILNKLFFILAFLWFFHWDEIILNISSNLNMLKDKRNWK